MKKNSIFKIVLLAILCVTICTWIFPAISYSGELVESDRVQAGIFDLFSYALDLFRYFPYVLITTLSIGAFYGVAYRIPAYRVLLDKIVEIFKGKENIFLVATIIIISVIVSVTGLSFGMLFVFPLIISIILLMGYNKLVAASTTVGSVVVGLLGTTVGTYSVEYINYVLGVKTTDEMVTKVILLLVGIVLLAYHVISYSNKTKNDTDKVLELVPASFSRAKEVKVVKEEVKATKDSKTKNKTNKKEKEEKQTKKTTKKTTSKNTTKKKAPAKKTTTKKTRANDLASSDVKVVKNSKNVSILPFVILFDIALIVIALGVFDWSLLNATWPTDALNAIRDFKIGGFPIISKLLGDSSSLAAFGGWGLNVEIPATIIITTCLLAFIYGVKFDKFIEGIVDGIKKACIPAFIMFITYLVLIIATYNPFQLHFAKFFLGMTKGLNVITMTITAFFASIFNVESIYQAQSTLPYVTSIVTDSTLYPIVGVIFQAVYGLTMLIAPTSVILVGTLAYLDIPYTQWIKHIWKLFLELLLVLIVVFFVLVVI